MKFSDHIIEWYLKNKRELPWRKTTDPYRIWLSEIMLQQTRVAQGLPYYIRFIEAFPAVEDLASASEDEVLKLWQGLGYYSRARNLHATAKQVAFQLGGKFPGTYNELLKLKGIGDYTASAIASISYGETQPVVDGNVYRVLARYFGVQLPVNSTEGVKYFKELAHKVKDSGQIGVYNQGVMEFGAVQCKPQSPDCTVCPLQADCVAYNTHTVSVLPVKLKTQKVQDRYYNYIVFIDSNNYTLLQKRTKKGIWFNLFEFPLIETEEPVDDAGLLLGNEIMAGISKAQVQCFYKKDIVHKLSHRNLHTKFWIVTLQHPLEKGVPVHTIKDYAVPVLIANFIEEFGF